MTKTKLFLTLGLLAFATTASAQGSEACAKIATIFDAAVEEWPDLLSTQRVKPRMAAVKIGTAAGINVNYAIDAGWSDEDLAPIIALRDTREMDPALPEFSRENVPPLLHGHLLEIAEVMALTCPDTEVADITDLSTVYPAE